MQQLWDEMPRGLHHQPIPQKGGKPVPRASNKLKTRKAAQQRIKNMGAYSYTMGTHMTAQNISNSITKGINIRHRQSDAFGTAQVDKTAKQGAQRFTFCIQFMQDFNHRLIVTKQLYMLARQLITQQRQRQVNRPQLFNINVVICPSRCPPIRQQGISHIVVQMGTPRDLTSISKEGFRRGSR
jgi:hypothetical protein